MLDQQARNSSMAFLKSACSRHLRVLPQRSKSTSKLLRLRSRCKIRCFDRPYSQKSDPQGEEDYADDAQVETAQSEAVEEATKRSAPLTQEERRLLNEMRVWAEQASHRMDSKAQGIDWIESNLKTDGEWNDRRVILFTEYRTTHQWLHEILASRGFGGRGFGIIHGGMSNDEREPIKAAFQTNPGDAAIRILLATDAASEGIDLQNYCNCMIHVEIPYNPNVMEQHNGRIDRHGQKEKRFSFGTRLMVAMPRTTRWGGTKTTLSGR